MQVTYFLVYKDIMTKLMEPCDAMFYFLLQTISLLVYQSGGLGKNGPFLVLSPLSVMENWRSELER